MSNKPFSASRFAKRNWLWLVAVAFIGVLVIGYAAGYRIGPGLSIVKAGTLVIPELPAGSSIYVDTKLRSVVRDGGEYRTRLTPGTHVIIVDALNHLPWHDAVRITSSEVTTISPVLVRRNPEGTILKDAERAAALATIDAHALPTDAAPLVAGCTEVYVSQNRLIGRPASGCETPPEYLCTGSECSATVLLSPIESISSVTLFPDRTDTLVFTIGDWIYALDVDPREPRFFAPILRRDSPRLGPAEAGAIILKDDEQAYRFTL